MSGKLPPALAKAASRAAPVRPLLPPIARATLPLGVALAIGTAAVLGADLREDAAGLGGAGLWTPVLARILAAAWLLLLALRESSPSEGLPRIVRAGSLALVPLVLLVSAEWLVRSGAGGGRVPGSLHCYGLSLGLTFPAAGLAAWLVARAYPLRPMIAGASGGAGVGLIADAVMHATCSGVERAHTLLAHGGSVVTAALVLATAVGLVCSRRPCRPPIV